MKNNTSKTKITRFKLNRTRGTQLCHENKTKKRPPSMEKSSNLLAKYRYSQLHKRIQFFNEQ